MTWSHYRRVALPRQETSQWAVFCGALDLLRQKIAQYNPMHNLLDGRLVVGEDRAGGICCADRAQGAAGAISASSGCALGSIAAALA